MDTSTKLMQPISIRPNHAEVSLSTACISRRHRPTSIQPRNRRDSTTLPIMHLRTSRLRDTCCRWRPSVLDQVCFIVFVFYTTSNVGLLQCDVGSISVGSLMTELGGSSLSRNILNTSSCYMLQSTSSPTPLRAPLMQPEFYI